VIQAALLVELISYTILTAAMVALSTVFIYQARKYHWVEFRDNKVRIALYCAGVLMYATAAVVSSGQRAEGVLKVEARVMHQPLYILD